MAQEHQVSFVPLTRRLVTFTHFRALSLIDFCAQGGAVHVAATTFGSVTHVEHFKQAVRSASLRFTHADVAPVF